MGMAACGECGKEISRSARACPHCGKRKTSFFTKLVAIFFVFSGVMILVVNATAPSNPAVSTPAEPPDPFSAARGACRFALMETLHDPESAELNRSGRWYVERQKDGAILVQPSGRAKNAFGAYINSVWDCVVREEGENLRVVKLQQVRP